MFIEQLRRKIHTDHLVQRIRESLEKPEAGSGVLKVDREALRELLIQAGYTPQTERDLTLFKPPPESDHQHILVFDNDIAFYRTTPADIGLRKSPTLKEMISIRNAIKIVHDKDVVVSRRNASLTVLHQEALSKLDLTFTKADLEELVLDGRLSLEKSYSEGVTDILSLFAELLKYTPAPANLQFKHYTVIGNLQQDLTGKPLFGPMILYQRLHNTLKLIENPINPHDATALEKLKPVILGKTSADLEGPEVFKKLADAVCEKYRGDFRVV